MNEIIMDDAFFMRLTSTPEQQRRREMRRRKAAIQRITLLALSYVIVAVVSALIF